MLRCLPDDDEKASEPTATVHLAILQLPTIHSPQNEFNQSLNIAFKFESQIFATTQMSNFMEFSCDIESAYDSDVSENQPQTILLSCGYQCSQGKLIMNKKVDVFHNS